MPCDPNVTLLPCFLIPAFRKIPKSWKSGVPVWNWSGERTFWVLRAIAADVDTATLPCHSSSSSFLLREMRVCQRIATTARCSSADPESTQHISALILHFRLCSSKPLCCVCLGSFCAQHRLLIACLSCRRCVVRACPLLMRAGFATCNAHRIKHSAYPLQRYYLLYNCTLRQLTHSPRRLIDSFDAATPGSQPRAPRLLRRLFRLRWMR